MREMFNKIAPKYDFITRVISYGMDGRWKRLGVLRASLPENALVLDLASGTGDFSRLVRERLPAARSVAVDLSEGMLRVGRRHGLEEAVCADATACCHSPQRLSIASSSATACEIFRISTLRCAKSNASHGRAA